MKALLRGAPRTGTHLFSEWAAPQIPSLHLVDENRHRPILWSEVGKGSKIIVCMKNPLSWLVSFFNYLPKNGPATVDGLYLAGRPTFADFVHSNDNLFHYWKSSYGNWLGHDAVVVVYEVLLRNPTRTLREIARKLGTDGPNRAQPFPETALYKGKPMDFAYYLEEKWRRHFDSELYGYCVQRFGQSATDYLVLEAA